MAASRETKHFVDQCLWELLFNFHSMKPFQKFDAVSLKHPVWVRLEHLAIKVLSYINLLNDNLTSECTTYFNEFSFKTQDPL